MLAGVHRAEAIGRREDLLINFIFIAKKIEAWVISFEGRGGGGEHKRLKGSDHGRGDVGEVSTSSQAFQYRIRFPLRVQRASLGGKC